MKVSCLLSMCLLLVAVPMAPLCAAERRKPVEIPQQAPPHPRLFINQEEIDALKEWSQQTPWLSKYLDNMEADLSKTVDDPELPTENRGPNKKIARDAHRYAITYALRGQKKFAEAAAAILRAYVDLFPGYLVSGMKGKATSATLGECDWALDAASAYDLIYNAGVLSDEDKIAIEQQVLKASAEVMRDCNHRYRSNWRGRAIAGVAAIGFCIDDRDLMEEAVNGARDDRGRVLRDGFVQHVAWSILADGVFYERSMHYHLYTADAYAIIAEAARHRGMDLWNLEVMGHPLDAGTDLERNFGPTGKKTVKAVFDSPFYEAFSDGSLVRLGNSYTDRLERKRCYERAWQAYRDPKFAWILQRPVNFVRPIAGGGYIAPGAMETAVKKAKLSGKSPRRPLDPLELIWLAPELPEGSFDHTEDARIGVTGRHENVCTLLPNGGITVLRESADANSLGVQMTYGDWGSCHTHPELLAIAVSLAGHQVIPEVRYHHYGHKDFLSWDRQSIAHNTVTVDEISQYPQEDGKDVWVVERGGKQARGKPIFFHPGEQLKAFRAECAAAYEGVLLDRTIVLLGDAVVDFFRCRSEQPHTYDYALHLDGELATASLPIGPEAEGSVSDKLGYEHLKSPRHGQLNGEAETLHYSTPAEPLQIDLLSSGPSELTAAIGHADLKGKTKEVLLLRKTGKNADFVDVLSFPTRAAGQQFRQLTDLPDAVLGVERVDADGTRWWVLSAEEPQTFAYGGQQVTGQLALLKKTKAGDVEVVEVVP